MTLRTLYQYISALTRPVTVQFKNRGIFGGLVNDTPRREAQNSQPHSTNSAVLCACTFPFSRWENGGSTYSSTPTGRMRSSGYSQKTKVAGNCSCPYSSNGKLVPFIQPHPLSQPTADSSPRGGAEGATRRRVDYTAVTACFIAAMNSGFVPQQPPRRSAPFWAHCFMMSAKPSLDKS